MQNIIEKDVFESFNNYSHFVVWWLAFSSILTFIKIGMNKKKLDHNEKLESGKENMILEEMPGITLILLHTACWCMSKETSSKVIFSYWGPMYLVTAYYVLFKKDTDWKQIAIPSSIMCKCFYVLFVAIFGSLGMTLPIYCYSLWIMHDQVRLAWFKNNADRSRRLFEDGFIFRIGYPLFLLLPFWDENFYHRDICMGISSAILLGWGTGIARLVKNGTFFTQPKIEGFGRDIVYM